MAGKHLLLRFCKRDTVYIMQFFFFFLQHGLGLSIQGPNGQAVGAHNCYWPSCLSFLKLDYWQDLPDDGNMMATLTMPGPSDTVTSLGWSPDGHHLAVVGSNRDVFIWSVHGHRKVEKRLCGHLNALSSCRYSHDGTKLFTSSFDTRVICWDVDGEISSTSLNTCHQHPARSLPAARMTTKCWPWMFA